MTQEFKAINVATALAIHEEAVRRFGGMGGVRDEGLLESAMAQPLQSFGGEDLYEGAPEKSARYAFGIAKNHPFADGNKRTAAAIMGAAARLNGIDFRPASEDFLATMLGVADGSISADSLAEWIDELG